MNGRLSTLTDIPLPEHLGLPSIYTQLRPEQWQAVEHTLWCGKRFVGLSMPTGSGKSLIPLILSNMLNRICILCSTKGLMDQYIKTVKGGKIESTFRELRGRENYECVDGQYSNCKKGQDKCSSCYLAGGGGYMDRLRQAQRAKVVVTNYAMWMNINRRSELGAITGEQEEDKEIKGLGKFDLLILDEAHLAPRELEQFLRVEIGKQDLELCEEVGVLNSNPIPTGKDIDEIEAWSGWAVKARKVIADRLKKLGDGEKKKKEDLTDLMDRLYTVESAKSEHWVCTHVTPHQLVNRSVRESWGFDPVYAGGMAERRIFHGIPKVVFLSGTLHQKVFPQMGVRKEHYSFKEWPRVFPANRCPVVVLPGVRTTRHKTKKELWEWLLLIDSIIAVRLDRKGIIHTVSYERQRYLVENSRFKEFMIANESWNTAKKVEEFKNSSSPSILVSPSLSTGWDFPGELAEYQIVSKIPFQNTNNKLAKERKKRDKKHYDFLTMTEFVQMCGRLMRSKDDRGETIVVDRSLYDWFWYQNKGLAPKSFEDQVRFMLRAPEPPISLYSEFNPGN